MASALTRPPAKSTRRPYRATSRRPNSEVAIVMTPIGTNASPASRTVMPSPACRSSVITSMKLLIASMKAMLMPSPAEKARLPKRPRSTSGSAPRLPRRRSHQSVKASSGTAAASDTHVSNILAKLGVTSRTAAAAIAHRRGLFEEPKSPGP